MYCEEGAEFLNIFNWNSCYKILNKTLTWYSSNYFQLLALNRCHVITLTWKIEIQQSIQSLRHIFFLHPHNSYNSFSLKIDIRLNHSIGTWRLTSYALMLTHHVSGTGSVPVFKLASFTTKWHYIIIIYILIKHGLESQQWIQHIWTTINNICLCRSHWTSDTRNTPLLVIFFFGCAMAQAVSRRPLTAEVRVRSRVSPCEIFVGQSGTGTGFSTSTSVFPCQFNSTGAP